jgi:hypothetical protein
MTMCPKPFAGEGDPGLTMSTTHQTRSLERASDPPPSERALRPLVFLVFCLSADGLHLAEGGVFGASAQSFKARLDSIETTGDFDVGGAKHVFRVELETAGEGAQRDEQIAQVLRTLRHWLEPWVSTTR